MLHIVISVLHILFVHYYADCICRILFCWIKKNALHYLSNLLEPAGATLYVLVLYFKQVCVTVGVAVLLEDNK